MGQTRLQLVDYSSLWSHDDSGADLGTEWRSPNYDDQGWESGAGPLGFLLEEPLQGITTMATLVDACLAGGQRPCDTQGQVRTYCFRHRFNFTNLPTAVVLTTSNLIDDGTVIFLNNQQILTVGMDTNVTASTFVGDAAYEGPFQLAVTGLVSGDNLLAAEVHQRGPTDSDTVFGLELRMPSVPSRSLEPPTPTGPQIAIRRLPTGQVRIDWGGTRAKLQQTRTLPADFWLDVPGQPKPFLTTPVGDFRFYRVVAEP